MGTRWQYLPTLLIVATLGAFMAFGGPPAVRSGSLVVTHVASLPADPVLTLGGAQAKLGWLHREYSVMDLPFWIYDEQGFVLYLEDGLRREYKPLSEAQVERIEALSGASLGSLAPMAFTERFAGFIVLAGVFFLAAFAGCLPARRDRTA